jgi:hypothetical protein
VLPLIADRGGKVWLCDRLHAKVIRADGRALIGSANLTGAALGWSFLPNLELLSEVPADNPQLLELFSTLEREAVRATPELAREVERVAALLPVQEMASAFLSDQIGRARQHAPELWYPQLRQPEDLYTAYAAGIDRLSRASATAAAADLETLQLPGGLTREQFDGLVSSRLLQTPLISAIDRYLDEPRRFGAVRDLIVFQLAIDRDEADAIWQTTMRWLLEFIPHRYERRVERWTEVLVRRHLQGDHAS